MTQTGIYNKELDAYNVPKKVYNAIQNAAAKTGVNFTYLMEKAAAESSFDTNAKSKTSSATGLYQFIDSTWLNMVKDHGDKYGLGKYAAKIDDNGKVADSKTRTEILNLRKDPEISSLMAAEFDSGNYDYLKQTVGGDVGSTELYMAHFLGAGGASGFLNAMNKSPNMVAADIFPKEALSNRNVFYDSATGQPRTLKQVYAFFDKKFDGTSGATTNFASNTTNNEALRINNDATQTTTQAKANIQMDDPFSRIATLLGTNTTSNSTSSMLRLSGSSTQNSQDGWQIFPPSLYSRLSLSPAQMMMLSDFSA